MVFLENKQMSSMHIPICQVNIGKFSTAVWQHKSTYLQTVSYVWHYRSLKRNYLLHKTIKDEITIWLITANMNQAKWLGFERDVSSFVLKKTCIQYFKRTAKLACRAITFEIIVIKSTVLLFYMATIPAGVMPEKTSYCHTI